MATPCELITEQMGLLYRCSQIGQYIRQGSKRAKSRVTIEKGVAKSVPEE